jgi:regulator of protease activity HflC (stomatin/prohibitin superfamily)
MNNMDALLLIVVVLVALFFIGSFARILREYERAVIFRLGRSTRAILNPGGQGNGPGLVLLVPLIDKMVKVSMQTVALDVAPQDVITRDNVSIKVSAVLYFRVVDPERAVIAVQDYLYATSQISQTTLRSVLGQVELDDLLSARDKINQQLQRIIDEHTEPWGIKVANVEVKQIDLPQDMQRAMAKQAEAERERRAKVINADGEFQAAAKLSEAAEVLTRHPIAVQLRYLQTMREIASERSTTTFFPLPIDLFGPLLQAFGKSGDGQKARAKLRVGDDGLGHPGRALARARRPKEDTGHGDSFAVGQCLVRALIDLSQIQGDARAPVGLQLHRVTGDPLDVAVDSKTLLAVAWGRIDYQANQQAENPGSWTPVAAHRADSCREPRDRLLD